MNKKVLIITYYWPPAGGPGVQRVLKFAKYLPEFGWDPIILTVDNGDYHATDGSLLKDVPKNIKVYKVKSFSVLDLYKKLKGSKKQISSFELTKKGGIGFKLVKWIRANFFIPDARKGWNRAAVKIGAKVIRDEKIDLVFISSPPHSLQLIGRKLKQKTGVKWFADFRDPWTDAFWDKNLPRLSVLHKFNMFLEKKIMTSADSLSSVSLGFIELLKKDNNVDFNLIPNGFDSLDFKNYIYQRCEKFRITYIGSIANSQNPINFFKGLYELPDDIVKDIEVNFYGLFDSSVVDSAMRYGKSVTFNTYISHEDAIEKMVNSEILLLLIPKNTKGILTGKLYEYLAAKSFILAIAPIGSEIEETVEACNSGITINFETDLTNIITEQYRLWEQNIRLVPNSEAIIKFKREHLTMKLAQLFDKAVG